MVSLLPLLLILLPLLSGLLLLCCQKYFEEQFGKAIALWTSGIVGALAVWLWCAVDQAMLVASPEAALPPISTTVLYAPEFLTLVAPGGLTLQFAVGADAIGSAMVLLTALVSWASLSVATQHIDKRFTSYAGWLMLAEAGLLLVFLAQDIFLFYFGFELALLPLLVLIAGWGDDDSGRIAKRFVLFTLAGSIPMVLALIGIVGLYSTPTGAVTLFSDLAKLAATSNSTLEQQQWIFVLLLLGLGIKMALIPLHTWLPDTYRAAAPTTTALLAAVVLKMGLFGFFRLAIPMLPAATEAYGPTILGTMGVIAILYGGLSALAQRDLRLLLAYSSLSHVGFITLGMFSLTPEGVAGAALQMFNHGITTAAMFLLAGCFIYRRGTANIQSIGSGLAAVYPRMAILTVFFLMAGAGMPGASNFVGELLALSGMMVKHPSLAGVAIIGVLLGAWYSLKLAKDILFGKTQIGSQRRVRQFDLSLAEWLPLAAMAVLSLYIGLWPQGALAPLQNDTNRLTQRFENNDASVAVNSIRSTEQATATALKSATKMELPH